MRRGSIFTTVAILAVFLSSCSTARKVSKVGIRSLSSEEAAQRDMISGVRAKAENGAYNSKLCPKEINSEFAKLAAAKVPQPSCPQGFLELVQVSSSLLKLEERSLLEELANTQCRALVDSEQYIYVRNFLDRYESDGPIGRRKGITESVISMAEDFKTLERLRSFLDEILSVNLPMERWIARNGGYVFPEVELGFFYNLVTQNNCRVNEDDIDDGFRAMQTLEELRRLIPEGATKNSLELFMQGIHRVIDKKVGEYFLSYAAQ